jgi:putative membrane protein
MIFTLEADRHAAFDRIYVNGQVQYQKGNAALFEQEIQNGTDPNLKESAARPCRRSWTICTAPRSLPLN